MDKNHMELDKTLLFDFEPDVYYAAVFYPLPCDSGRSTGLLSTVSEGEGILSTMGVPQPQLGKAKKDIGGPLKRANGVSRSVSS